MSGGKQQEPFPGFLQYIQTQLVYIISIHKGKGNPLDIALFGPNLRFQRRFTLYTLHRTELTDSHGTIDAGTHS